jgi:hypothetical protein
MKLHYLLIAAMLLSPGALAFSLHGAEAWFVSGHVDYEGTIVESIVTSQGRGRLFEDHTSSSVFFPNGTLGGVYKIRANYPLNNDPTNNYVLLMTATSNVSNTIVSYVCEGMTENQITNGLSSRMQARTFDDMESINELPKGLGGALRLPLIEGTTYGRMFSPQAHPLQPSGLFASNSSQYTNSQTEADSVTWWMTCYVSVAGGDVWLTGTVLRDKTSVVERHFATLNDEFNTITSRTYQTIDMLDDILYAIIIVIGVILVIFIFVFIWKTFEYFINMSRRP